MSGAALGLQQLHTVVKAWGEMPGKVPGRKGPDDAG